MKAITAEPQKAGSARLEDVPEPDAAGNRRSALRRGPDDIKVVVQFSEA